MENELLKTVFKLKNRTDIDDFLETTTKKIRDNEVYYPLYNYLEALYLYNMYADALDNEDGLTYLYPYKLRKIIEIGNSSSDKPLFVMVNQRFAYNGSIKIKELDGILEVLIKYGNLNFIIKLLTQVLPLIESIKPLENLFVALGIMKYQHIELPKKIGDSYTEDYMALCTTLPFFPDARAKLKKFIAILQLPKKAKAMYFQLNQMYKALEESAIFDFGTLSLQCFKIIEISTKAIIANILSGLSNQDIYQILPDDLKDMYKEDTFKVERLEIGKIYVLLSRSIQGEDSLSLKIKNYFKDDEIIEKYMSYISPKNVNKYRNGPAHGDYVPQEIADEALKLLDSFINEALYVVNKL